MIGEIIAGIIRFVFTFLIRILIGLLGVPMGVLYLLKENFPNFSAEGGFFFWVVFGVAVIILYYILWKPILWISGLTAVTGEDLF